MVIKSSDINPAFIEEVCKISGPEVKACFNCGTCSGSCPAGRVTSFRTRRLLRRAMFGLGKELLASNDLWLCTVCGLCYERCPRDVNPSAAIMALRNLAGNQGLWPENIKTITSAIKDSRNVFNMLGEDRNLWAMMVEDVVKPRMNRSADVAYFVGCVSSYTGRISSIPESMVNILEASGTDYCVLGGEEWCCGDPLYLVGDGTLAKPFAEHNIKNLKELGVKTVVTTCAGCYRAFKKEYPKAVESLPFEVLHSSEFIFKLLKEGKLRLSTPLNVSIVYHDPCEIARHCNVYDPPREVLKSIPELRVREFSMSREESQCCGGGGMVRATNPDVGTKIAARKVLEAQHLGAYAIVSGGCPACKLNLTEAATQLGSEIRVMDMVEVVSQSL